MVPTSMWIRLEIAKQWNKKPPPAVEQDCEVDRVLNEFYTGEQFFT